MLPNSGVAKEVYNSKLEMVGQSISGSEMVRTIRAGESNKIAETCSRGMCMYVHILEYIADVNTTESILCFAS